jgi:hypothetical protein
MKSFWMFGLALCSIAFLFSFDVVVATMARCWDDVIGALTMRRVGGHRALHEHKRLSRRGGLRQLRLVASPR